MGMSRGSGAKGTRGLAAVVLAWAIAAGMPASAVARDSTFTLTLTLRGVVAADVGFGRSFGGIYYGPFCVSRAERDRALHEDPSAPPDPVCRSGRTYSIRLQLRGNESGEYEIGLYHPSTGTWLWEGTLVGDSRDHRLDYVYVFGLPATDSEIGRVPERHAWDVGYLAAVLMSTLVSAAGSTIVLRRRARRTAASTTPKPIKPPWRR